MHTLNKHVVGFPPYNDKSSICMLFVFYWYTIIAFKLYCALKKLMDTSFQLLLLCSFGLGLPFHGTTDT